MLSLHEVGVPQRLLPFSARVEPGQQVHLIGPNGAGKSTLLASLAGMLPSTGEIVLNGTPLKACTGSDLARLRSYLAQQQSPVSLMPVFQFLALHQPAAASENDVEQTIAYLTLRLRLNDKLARSVNQLSGGEWQRVRLAASLLQVWPTLNPDSQLLLLDEPENSLDVAQKLALNELIDEFCQSGRSVIISAHDLNQTLQQANQVWLMQHGSVIACGSAEEVMQPAILSPVFEVGFQLHSLENHHWLMTRTA